MWSVTSICLIGVVVCMKGISPMIKSYNKINILFITVPMIYNGMNA